MNIKPMLFEKANQLTADATATAKGLILFASISFIVWLMFKREGTGKIVMACVTVGLAIWLVALSGVETIAGMFGQTLES